MVAQKQGKSECAYFMCLSEILRFFEGHQSLLDVGWWYGQSEPSICGTALAVAFPQVCCGHQGSTSLQIF
jgi:hypothetical protein